LHSEYTSILQDAVNTSFVSFLCIEYVIVAVPGEYPFTLKVNGLFLLDTIFSIFELLVFQSAVESSNKVTENLFAVNCTALVPSTIPEGQFSITENGVGVSEVIHESLFLPSNFPLILYVFTTSFIPLVYGPTSVFHPSYVNLCINVIVYFDPFSVSAPL
jgi:hypothetical protein